MKRHRSLDTVGVFDSTKHQVGPVRVVLMRTYTPEGDPYERWLSPQADLRPYLEGKVRYSVVLFLGSRCRLQLELGERT